MCTLLRLYMVPQNGISFEGRIGVRTCIANCPAHDGGSKKNPQICAGLLMPPHCSAEHCLISRRSSGLSASAMLACTLRARSQDMRGADRLCSKKNQQKAETESKKKAQGDELVREMCGLLIPLYYHHPILRIELLDPKFRRPSSSSTTPPSNRPTTSSWTPTSSASPSRTS